MLQIVIPPQELFNEETFEITYTKGCTLNLEHSLISISKWESKWRKPFLDTELSFEEKKDYIRCMTLDRNIPSDAYDFLTTSNYNAVDEYIDNPMTATWFNDMNKGHSKKEIITNEIIYYWMVSNQIPFECEKWHLNRLLTLIRVCSEKNQPEKKIGKHELMQRNRALNAARRKKLHSSG